MKAHLYLRASTRDQDSNRALDTLQSFANEKGLEVAGVYSENISGTKLQRPQLMSLLDQAVDGDVLLVESVDRLSRLSQCDWATLKRMIEEKGLRLVVQDLPTSHAMLSDATDGSDTATAVLRVINNMLLDLMSTMARLDQEKRVERIKQGLDNKKKADPGWKPTGKKKNQKLHDKVLSLMEKHTTLTVQEIADLAGCGVATVYRIKKEAAA